MLEAFGLRLAEFPQPLSVGQKTGIVGDLVCLTRIRAGWLRSGCSWLPVFSFPRFFPQ